VAKIREGLAENKGWGGRIDFWEKSQSEVDGGTRIAAATRKRKGRERGSQFGPDARRGHREKRGECRGSA